MKNGKPKSTSEYLVRYFLSAIICFLTSGSCYSQTELKRTFGHRQLEQMVEDRPSISKIIQQHPRVRQKLIDCFNGANTGHRVYWVASSISEAMAAHAPKKGGYPAHIWVANSSKISPTDLVASAIYEFYNLEGDFLSIRRLALSSKIGKQQFVDRCLKLEFAALKKAGDYFKKQPLPTGEDDVWYNGFFGSGAMANQPMPTDNAKYFGEYYDGLLPFINREQGAKERGQVQLNETE